MLEQYQKVLKTGEVIYFRTNMPLDEVQSLPNFSNQHGFYSYIKGNGFTLKIDLILKK